jgi:selenide, water dikinase
VLKGFPPSTDPNLMVGFETSDDAAVYRLNNDHAVVSTVDFITPPVDDPVWFGRIAAANSLSDIYAMGGQPLTALSLVMFPAQKLGLDILRGILHGGHEKVVEAGASLCGGHSVDDDEPKYGLAVTGLVHPQRILTNTGVQPGDVLLLTKPIGTGVLFNAHRARKLPWSELEPVLADVAALNRMALEVALHFEIHACTDVTGFGLLGHTLEMAKGSNVAIRLDYSALPVYPNALAMYGKGQTTGSNAANRKLVQDHLRMKIKLSRAQEELLFDPQTSGGLLMAVAPDHAGPLLEELKAAGVKASRAIGEALPAIRPEVMVVL